MESLKFKLPTKNLKLVNIPKLQIDNPNDILVKTAYAGICGTDLHIMAGEFPCEPNNEFTLGHEFCGTVVDVGSNVKNVKKGDRVVVDPNHGCDVCQYCHSGNPHYCKIGGINNTIGIFKNGGWAEYALVPETQIHKLPETITFEQAALAEPLSCLAHGWDRISPVTVGQKILILGAGIIGNLWVVALHLQGHRNVTISEPNAKRRELLQNLGTGFEAVQPEVLKERQSGDSNYVFDLIIDCSGFAPAIEHAFTLLNRGGTLCIFGVAPPHSKVSISPFEMYMREAKMLGVNINPFTFPKAIGLLESLGDRYLNYEKLGIKTFALKDYQTAIDSLKAGNISKAVFKM